MTIAYELEDSLYLNITNECPCSCTFCIRGQTDGVNPGESLWLDHEPSLEEILAAIKPLDFKKYKEVVFCGYGEPTSRLDILLDCARVLKEKKLPIRLNTNGLSDLVNKKETVPLLAGLIDTVSISLNAPDAKSYNELCVPIYPQAYQAILNFAEECKKQIDKVIFSVYAPALDEESIEKCQTICNSMDIPLRLRR